jgi:hypothetical protein
MNSKFVIWQKEIIIPFSEDQRLDLIKPAGKT